MSVSVCASFGVHWFGLLGSITGVSVREIVGNLHGTTCAKESLLFLYSFSYKKPSVGRAG